MKLPLRILVLLSAVLWISSITMFAIGMMIPGLSILRFGAIPDAVIALVFSALAAQKWSGGS